MPLEGKNEKQDAQKSYDEILGEEIKTGLKELNRPTIGLLMSGLSAGLDIGFSLFLMAVIYTRFTGTFSDPVVETLVAAMYPVGFIFVILGRSELFTEHTTRAVLPVISGHASIAELMRLWGLVYVANQAGATLFAFAAVVVGPALGIIDVAAFEAIARHVVRHPWWVILLSAILAGWLMGLLSWLVTAARDTIGQLVVVTLVTMAIGMAGFHHAIVGTTEIMAGILTSPDFTLRDYATAMTWTTMGNAVGGVFFVAIIKYSHATR